MDNVMEHTVNKNHIQFHMIPSKKFKTITIVVKLRAPLDRTTVTKRALLPYLLKQGTKNYPSKKLLMKKLDELYGAVLEITCAKKGENHILHFQLEFANQKFINNETTVLDEALQLLNEIIFAPSLDDRAFPEKTVQFEKRQLENKIDGIIDRKVAYANERLLDKMCQQERFSIHTNGYVGDLPTINGKNMYDYYQTVLQTDQFDFYILGDFNVAETEKKITDLFKRDEQKEPLEIPESQTQSVKIDEVQIVKETMEMEQAKLHIGYRTNCTYQDDSYAALQVFNGLFGGFPSSKLFMNIREKHSLAYYIASRVESIQGLLIVYSGIEATSFEQALQITKNQLQEIVKGNVTEDELEETKGLLISGLRETLDHPTGTIELLYQQIVGEKKLPPHAFIDNIKQVSMEEVIAIARNIELDTIYLLSAKVGE